MQVAYEECVRIWIIHCLCRCQADEAGIVAIDVAGAAHQAAPALMAGFMDDVHRALIIAVFEMAGAETNGIGWPCARVGSGATAAFLDALRPRHTTDIVRPTFKPGLDGFHARDDRADVFRTMGVELTFKGAASDRDDSAGGRTQFVIQGGDSTAYMRTSSRQLMINTPSLPRPTTGKTRVPLCPSLGLFLSRRYWLSLLSRHGGRGVAGRLLYYMCQFVCQ